MTENIVATGRTIVVGLEDSRADQTALACAAGEAMRRGLPLQLVHAEDLPLWLARDHRLRQAVIDDATTRTEKLFDRARAQLRAYDSGLTIGTHLGWGPAAAVLLSAVREASLVVLGSSPRTDERYAGLRPVASHVAAHAPCPVMVAREPAEGVQAQDKVIAGVDGSRISAEAVGFAFEEAAYRRTNVVAMMAWMPEITAFPVIPGDPDTEHELAAATLAESVAGWRERYPDVDLEQRLVRDHPVRALLDAGQEAAMLVVGSHGRGWFPGMLLGSVSNALIRRSPVTLAIVRASAS